MSRECFRQSGVCTSVQIVDRPYGKQEARMIKLVIRLVTLAMFSMALVAAPSPAPVLAAGGGGGEPPPSEPPPSNTKATKSKKKTNKQSSIVDPAFARGYHEAY